MLINNLVQNGNKDVSIFINNQNFFFRFFSHLSEEIKTIVREILKHIESELLEKKDDYPEHIVHLFYQAISWNVYTTDIVTQLAILENIKEFLAEEINNGVVEVPSRKERGLPQLLTLFMADILSEEIKSFADENKEEFSNVKPEFDWLIFDSRTDETIEKLLKKYNYDDLKDFFLKTNEEKTAVSDYILKKYTK